MLDRQGRSGHGCKMGQILKFIRSWDPFLLCLIAVVAAASLVPVHGAGALWIDRLADFAIVLLFFIHGAKLSRAAMLLRRCAALRCPTCSAYS